MWTGGGGKSLKEETSYAPNMEMYFFDAFRLRHLIRSVPSSCSAEKFLPHRRRSDLQGTLINTHSTDVWEKFLPLKFAIKNSHLVQIGLVGMAGFAPPEDSL